MSHSNLYIRKETSSSPQEWLQNNPDTSEAHKSHLKHQQGDDASFNIMLYYKSIASQQVHITGTDGTTTLCNPKWGVPRFSRAL